MSMSKAVHQIEQAISTMNTKDVLPKAIYTKAYYYLKLGANRYRNFDRFKFPSARWTYTEIKKLEIGCLQVLAGKGLSKEKPLTKLGERGFLRLFQLFHYDIIKVQPSKLKIKNKMWLLDEITLKNADDKTILTAYNMVVPKIKKK